MNHDAIRTFAIDEAFEQMRKYTCEGDAPQHMISRPRAAPAQSRVRPEEYSRAEHHFFVREPCHHLKRSLYCGRDCAGTGLANGQVRTGGRQHNDPAMGHAIATRTKRWQPKVCIPIASSELGSRHTPNHPYLAVPVDCLKADQKDQSAEGRLRVEQCARSDTHSSFYGYGGNRS
jgi:hypothetical protein